MTAYKEEFRPDFAPAPGELLQEQLDTLEVSARELARRCGRSPKLISEILAGKAPVEPETALQFEHVLQIDATIWLNMEADYRLQLAKVQEDAELSNEVKWANSFPINELVKRGALERPHDELDAVRKLLRFFGLANASACRDLFGATALSYRHSPSFQSDQHALFSWLRLGELDAEKTDCREYDRGNFLEALKTIRGLTRLPIEKSYALIRSHCANAGVAFVILPPFKGMALSGVSRWLSPRKALVQQTLRHMADDHFWFTFFHEAAHILFHSRKSVFIDERGAAENDEMEEEANRWATSFLISPAAFERFCSIGDFSRGAVERFAEQQEIAAGIVVGQLQKFRKVPYSALNRLKEHFEWVETKSDE